ncbi:alpha-hydroxy-acid oxidizing protein [Ancylobacter sp. MQZ15Z-1]|uniref:Alpha-hydroxy-acid oxidizing protein n=1 Tax=Ancylobacter mangrovi TaxID=2972472 RepID=A0A9X2PBP2_9HYPH|nr:alpha-hydroxy acid oxidase [Ancylobacter mangrovi]MCS0494449.1 alpha-hydroxy-acid oxidizing protein [Ancylobacter mangrovi]
MNIDKIVTIDDLRAAARRRLPLIAFDFIDGGVESETCLARNRQTFQDYRLLPRYFVDISERSQKTTLFGVTYDSPLGICPTGISGLWRPGADEMLAQAAAEANIVFAFPCASNSRVEDGLARAPDNLWYQLYSTRERAVGQRLVGRIADLGFKTLVLTADVPIVPKRERNLRNGFTRPLKFKMSTVIDGLSRPGWLMDYLKAGGGTPMMPAWQSYVKEGATPDQVADFFGTQTPASEQTWADVEHYRRIWPGNLVIKGLLHPQDAVRAADLGIDGIIVSNHGGRQLDMAPTPIDMLPLIRATVGEKMVLMVDSGIRRGSDILIAMCLGAQFAFIGRPTLYGVAAFGLPGAKKAIEILRKEIDVNLGQMGRTSLAELGPHCLMQREPPFRIMGEEPAAGEAAAPSRKIGHA